MAWFGQQPVSGIEMAQVVGFAGGPSRINGAIMTNNVMYGFKWSWAGRYISDL
jgi:hypothetical protein